MPRTRKSRVRESLKNMTASPTSNQMPLATRVGGGNLPTWRIRARGRFARIVRDGVAVTVYADLEAQTLRVRPMDGDAGHVVMPSWVMVGVYTPPFEVDAFLADVSAVFGGGEP